MSVLVAQNIKSKYTSDFNHNFIEDRIYAIASDESDKLSHLLSVLSGKNKNYVGKIFLDGHNIKQNNFYKKRICYFSCKTTFMQELTVGSILRRMKRKFPKWDHILALDELNNYSILPKYRYGNLSTAQKDGLIATIAFASHANITFFDNPLEHCDAKTRYVFFDNLYKHHLKCKRVIIIASNRLNELSSIIDRVIFMQGANIFEEFTPKHIQENFVKLTGKSEVLKTMINTVFANLKPIGTEERKTVVDNETINELSIYYPKAFSKDAIRMCQKNQIEISTTPLDRVFIFLLLIKERKDKDRQNQFVNLN